MGVHEGAVGEAVCVQGLSVACAWARGVCMQGYGRASGLAVQVAVMACVRGRSSGAGLVGAITYEGRVGWSCIVQERCEPCGSVRARWEGGLCVSVGLVSLVS